MEVCSYGGRIFVGDGALITHLEVNPSNKVLQISNGEVPRYIDANDETLTLGGKCNHACGATHNCDANVQIVFDDEVRDQAVLVAMRDIDSGEEILLDYGIVYDEEVDSDDPTLDWLRDYECPFCDGPEFEDFDMNSNLYLPENQRQYLPRSACASAGGIGHFVRMDD